jgi:hypothetical protein
MGLRVSLIRRPSSFRRTSANDRPEETLTCSTAIVCDVTECCVGLRHVRSRFAAVFKCGEAAHRHMVTTSRRACRVRQATVSQRRRRVAVRAPTELGFAAAFWATSARPQRRYAVEQPTADGNETWLTRFLAAAMARRSKEAIRRASARTHAFSSATAARHRRSSTIYVGVSPLGWIERFCAAAKLRS